MERTKKSLNIRKIAVTAIMSALATILMYLEFPVPIIPSFIKFDFSDLPALITSFSFGPMWGALVCLLKNLIHLAVSQTGGVGELSNFCLGFVFTVVAGLFYSIKHNRKSALVGSLVGSLAMSVVCLPLNYYIIYPIYVKLGMPLDVIISAYTDILPMADTLWKDLLIFNAPFTFLKGLACMVITFIVYKKISPLLKGER